MKKNVVTLIMMTVALAFFAGCSSSKAPGDQTFGDDAGGGFQEETLYDGAPLPTREEGMDPSNADYQTLAKHTVYFGTDSFSIDPSERAKLQGVIDWMKSNPSAKLIVAGHCDDRGTTQYNLALGERRALSVRDFLSRLGADTSALSTVSYGEERPAVQGASESAWSKNRRAEIGILR